MGKTAKRNYGDWAGLMVFWRLPSECREGSVEVATLNGAYDVFERN